MIRVRQTACATIVVIATAAGVAACGNAPTAGRISKFLNGANGNNQIGLVVNSLGRSLTLFQLGRPTAQEQVAFGASNAITPVGIAVRGTTALVPLGDAASVALLDLDAPSVLRIYLFPSGNATGQAYVDDTTALAANTLTNVVGRFTTAQASDSITQTVSVAPSPGDIQVANGAAYVTSANLDSSYNPIGNGIVTKLNAATLAVLATGPTTGTNSTAATIGPDGHLYVVNTGDYVSQSTVTVMDTATLAVLATIPNAGVGAGAIAIDANGLAYISSFYSGTVIYNTGTSTYVRGIGNPLCVTAGGNCLGAFDARPDAAGDVYQTFFGTQSQPSIIYVYAHGTYVLTDSITVGQGPAGLRIATF
jgi:YVTN family beta-propeller protein